MLFKLLSGIPNGETQGQDKHQVEKISQHLNELNGILLLGLSDVFQHYFSDNNKGDGQEQIPHHTNILLGLTLFDLSRLLMLRYIIEFSRH